jgi:hypothetical protein
VLTDAHVYSEHAGSKSSMDSDDDVKLVVQSKVNLNLFSPSLLFSPRFLQNWLKVITRYQFQRFYLDLVFGKENDESSGHVGSSFCAVLEIEENEKKKKKSC